MTIDAGMTLGGRYRLDERIAGGGMGEVWRGTDQVLGRTIAVKVVLPSLLNEPGFAERFRGEARTMATINHPGVVDVYDYGSDDAVGAYLVMEYVEGDPLSRTLSRVGRLTPARTMDLVAQAAEALQAAHDRGIVHRDVKPANLLVRPDGRLVLTDFGIARSALVGQLTAVGSVLGTASYISPEQASGGVATPLSDVYALGVVAYQCLSGRRPFEGDNPLDIALKHVHERPAPLPPDTPPAVRTVVERAMAKDPAARFPTATAFAQAARQAGGGNQAAPVSPPAGPGGIARTAVLPHGASGSAAVTPGVIGVPAMPVLPPSSARPAGAAGAPPFQPAAGVPVAPVAPPAPPAVGGYSRGAAVVPPPMPLRRYETTYVTSPEPPVPAGPPARTGRDASDSRRLVLIGVLVGLVGVLLIGGIAAWVLHGKNDPSNSANQNTGTNVGTVAHSQPPANPATQQPSTPTDSPSPTQPAQVDLQCRRWIGRSSTLFEADLTANGFKFVEEHQPGGIKGRVANIDPCTAAPGDTITVTVSDGSPRTSPSPSPCDAAGTPQDCASVSPTAPAGGPAAN